MAGKAEGISDPIEQLEALRGFDGAIPAFWEHYLEALRQLVEARAGFLLSREREGSWQQRLACNAANYTASRARKKYDRMAALANEAEAEGQAVLREGEGEVLLAVPLTIDGDREKLVAAFDLGPVDEPGVAERLTRLRLAADRGSWLQNRRALETARGDLGAYTGILDVLVALYAEERFRPATLAFCNEMATRFDCDQVSIGLLKNNQFIRLQAISRTARFDPRMAVVRALENAMEEAIDQEQEVVYPRPQGHHTITREHEQLSREHGIDHLCTVPLRSGDQPVAAFTAQRADRPFREEELRRMSLAGALAAGYLVPLRERDRPFPLRWAGRIRKSLGRCLGVEHTWVKLLAFAISVILAVLFFVKGTFRVEAPFILKASTMSHLSAPFDGYLEQAFFAIGDRVEAGQELLRLDRRDLLLERSAAEADLQRYSRETEKFQAGNQLADMQISAARAQQARARLEQIDHRLDQAVIRAPFAAVVVEGAWEDKAGSPVRQGEPMARVARLDSLYIKLDISEQDITHVVTNATGRIAFASDPRRKYAVMLTRLHPAAVTGEKGVQFEARAAVQGEPEDWWRPGMSGVAKIDVDRRRLWWIYTRRTTDFLRRKFWW